MNRWNSLLLLGLGLLMGCGGSTKTSTASTVTGTVVDINNQPVRDAVVSSSFGTTRTSATGSFTMPRQGSGIVEYSALVTRNGVRYRGRTTAFNYSNERTQNVNIVIGLESELGAIEGQVVDRNGSPLQDASVYAYNGAGSSTRTFTDGNGNYRFDQLVGGVTYSVLAGGQGYRSDATDVSLGLGQFRTLDFVLDDPGDPNLQPPQNIGVTTWVSPADATRGLSGEAYDVVKRLFDPRYRAKAGARAGRGPGTTLYEVDLFWDEQRFPDLFGYGVYRGNGATGDVSGLDFLPDPLAAYYVDLSVRGDSTYSYALTTISTNFPDRPDETESGLSTRVVARTLDTLVLSNPLLKPLTFRWQAGSGAEEYVVYVFDEFPSVEVDPIWDTEQNRVSGTSVVYNGPNLPSGTYYYVVVGVANNDESRTVSQIGSFKL